MQRGAEGRDALAEEVLRQWIVRDRLLDVGVVVDEAGRNDPSGGVRHGAGLLRSDALSRDFDDPPVAHRHVRPDARSARAVDHRATTHEHVVGLRSRGGWRRESQRHRHHADGGPHEQAPSAGSAAAVETPRPSVCSVSTFTPPRRTAAGRTAQPPPTRLPAPKDVPSPARNTKLVARSTSTVKSNPTPISTLKKTPSW